MDAGITTVIDPLLLAKTGRHISGDLPLKDLPRLAELSSDVSAGQVHIELQFSQDENQRCWMQGEVSGQLEVICQRCLEPMTQKLDSQINALLVRQAGEVSGNDQESGTEETVIYTGNSTIAKLIEDDLLLAMPMFPKHLANECTPRTGDGEKQSFKNAGKNEGQKGGQRDNPFAVLATLKSGKKKG
jgi:uncharacterized protein